MPGGVSRSQSESLGSLRPWGESIRSWAQRFQPLWGFRVNQKMLDDKKNENSTHGMGIDSTFLLRTVSDSFFAEATIIIAWLVETRMGGVVTFVDPF